jgi:hypothetical protein
MAIARQGKTIVVDEAHLMFPHPNVVLNFLKNLESTKLATQISPLFRFRLRWGQRRQGSWNAQRNRTKVQVVPS